MHHHLLYVLVCLLAVGAGAAADPVPRPQVGLNLGSPNDFSTIMAFRNLAKQGRPWQTGPRQWVDQLTADRYPTTGSSYTTLILGDHHPAGTYLVTWRGKATVTVPRFDASSVKSDGANRLLVEVKPAKGLYVQVADLDPADPFTDLQVYAPGHEIIDSPFHPHFEHDIAGVQTVRFMDWMDTNASSEVSWDGRTKPGDATWNPRDNGGVPIEIMVELANRSGTNPWFCMPTKADDDYIRRFATYVRDHLDKRLMIYVEYSNEVWNTNFAATTYAQERSTLAKTAKSLERQSEFYAKRSVEIFGIWHDVFGTDKTRVKRVIAGWAANIEANSWRLTHHGAAKHADCLAIAPYFGFNKEVVRRDPGAMRTVDDVIASCRDVIEGPLVEMLRRNKNLANEHGLELIAYEAGQHLLAREERQNGGDLTDLFIKANRDPRMGDLYKRYLELWFANGGGLICMFSHVGKPGRFGMWGMKETLLETKDETAVKWRAVMDYFGIQER
jgi:hypothetical protein